MLFLFQHIEEDLLNLKFRISPTAFFQGLFSFHARVRYHLMNNIIDSDVCAQNLQKFRYMYLKTCI